MPSRLVFTPLPSISNSAELLEDPEERFVRVLQYYLSGWHIKPKVLLSLPCTPSSDSGAQGVKKPYNPVLGEFFRCRYDYPNGTQGFYIAEQGASLVVLSTHRLT